MTLEILRDILACNAVINILLLLIWLLFFALAHDWMYCWHSKWFKVSIERFDVIHYDGMAVLKIGIWLFILGPYLALRIVG